MTMTTTTTMTVSDYATGAILGRVELTAERVAAYGAAAQQPQGIVRAGAVLSPAELAQLGLTSSQTVWLE